MDEISNIRAQVDVLEGRVEAVEAAERGTDDAKFNQEAGVGINQDPKGRKIWECEWSKQNNCLMMFCPKGAVTVGTKMLDVDSTAAQREGDELKITTEGIWYLHVYNDRAMLDQEKPEEEESEKPEGQAEEEPNESGEEDGERAILECEIVEISKSKDYIEKQFVVGSVVLVEREAREEEGGSGGGGGKYEADERSVSLAASGDTAKNNRFKIFGFGTDGHRIDATYLEIGEEASEEEFIVRAKDADGEEFVGYRKIRVGSTSGRTPFEYQKIPVRDAEGDEVVGFIRKIVFNKFYFDGRFVDELDDYNIAGNPRTVWLECSRESEEISDPETGEEGSKESWRFAIVENQPKEDEHTVSVRLYDFKDNGDVEVDYRTTFLALNPKEKKEEKDEWANPKATIAYGGDEDEAPSVSLTINEEVAPGTSEDGGVAEEQKPTGKKQINLDIKLEKPVLTLNDLRDAVEIEGGSKISVTVEDQKIKISYDEKKPEEGEKEEEEKENPCDHDDSGSAGGVKSDDETHSGGGGAVGGGGDGGVPAGGEPHVGDDDCNCE